MAKTEGSLVLKVLSTASGYNFTFGKNTSSLEVTAVCGLIGRVLVRDGLVPDIKTFLEAVSDIATNTQYDEPQLLNKNDSEEN